MTVVGPRVESAGEERLSAVASYVALAQADPERHVSYVGTDIESIPDELTDAEQWVDRLLGAFVEGELAGVLLADVDGEMRRVWWVGPWADCEDVAIALLTEARDRFGALFDEEELAPDSRNEIVCATAQTLGFVEGTASSVLVKLDLSTDGVSSTQPLTDARAQGVADLHDSIFPGTHTSGAKLVNAGGTRVRTAQIDGATAGYVAYEVQPDGSGYIDYIGVRSDVRRRGIGRALVADACRDLAADGVSAVHLTVRADAPGAVDLYRSLGFIEERIIAPYRYGFTLG